MICPAYKGLLVSYKWSVSDLIESYFTDSLLDVLLAICICHFYSTFGRFVSELFMISYQHLSNILLVQSWILNELFVMCLSVLLRHYKNTLKVMTKFSMWYFVNYFIFACSLFFQFLFLSEVLENFNKILVTQRFPVSSVGKYWWESWIYKLVNLPVSVEKKFHINITGFTTFRTVAYETWRECNFWRCYVADVSWAECWF